MNTLVGLGATIHKFHDIVTPILFIINHQNNVDSKVLWFVKDLTQSTERENEKSVLDFYINDNVV